MTALKESHGRAVALVVEQMQGERAAAVGRARVRLW